LLKLKRKAPVTLTGILLAAKTRQAALAVFTHPASKSAEANVVLLYHFRE
jgi:hypothetical protein